MMLALSRHIPAAHSSTASGGWNRKAYVGNKLYETLGVVGLGKIGSHVARVAQAMGMEVPGYDPFISSERAQQLRVRLRPGCLFKRPTTSACTAPHARHRKPECRAARR